MAACSKCENPDRKGDRTAVEVALAELVRAVMIAQHSEAKGLDPVGKALKAVAETCAQVTADNVDLSAIVFDAYAKLCSYETEITELYAALAAAEVPGFEEVPIIELTPTLTPPGGDG